MGERSGEAGAVERLATRTRSSRGGVPPLLLDGGVELQGREEGGRRQEGRAGWPCFVMENVDAPARPPTPHISWTMDPWYVALFAPPLFSLSHGQPRMVDTGEEQKIHTLGTMGTMPSRKAT
jgi:hypothetical protein